MASSERTKGAEAGAAPRTATGAETGVAAAEQGAGPAAHREEGQSGLTSRPVASPTSVEAVTVSCLTNSHYHAAREAWLDTVHRWLMFFVIALGAAALTDILPKMVTLLLGVSADPALVKEVCAAGAAIMAALDLTFDLSNRARAHAMMKRRYYELLASVREGKRTATEARACLDQFSADEEPPYKVLFLACWNDAERSVHGLKARRFDISIWGNLWKNWFRRPSVTYPVIHAKSN